MQSQFTIVSRYLANDDAQLLMELKSGKIDRSPMYAPNCWAVALNLHRAESYIGSKELPEAGAFEEQYALRRDLFASLHEHFISMAQQLVNADTYKPYQLGTKAGALRMIDRLRPSLKNPNSEVVREATKTTNLLTAFTNQTACADLISFGQNQFIAKRLLLNLNFLKFIGLEPAALYAKIQQATEAKWDELSIQERLIYSDNYTFRATYKGLGFKESSWHPAQTIIDLLNSLRKEGTIQVKGFYGRVHQSRDPTAIEQIVGRIIYAVDETKAINGNSRTHSIVLVGANARNQRVFYVDPSDGSSRLNPNEQKIYSISYETLRNRAVDLRSQAYLGNGQFHPQPYGIYYTGTPPSNPIEAASTLSH